MKAKLDHLPVPSERLFVSIELHRRKDDESKLLLRYSDVPIADRDAAWNILRHAMSEAGAGLSGTGRDDIRDMAIATQFEHRFRAGISLEEDG